MSLALDTASAGGVTAVVEAGTIANCACKKIAMTSKADLKRFDKLQRIGCVCCRQLGFYSQADVHHVLTGGRRTGHQDTIPLCPYHHRGVGPMDTIMWGPSLAHGSKPFHARFGTQGELLAKVNELLREIA